jgi:transcriptional regulator with XRE-family HTH domain
VDVNVSIEDSAERGQAGLSLIELGTRIRAERERRGLSGEELAGRCRVSRSMLYEIERGRKAPTVLILDRIATGLGTSIARLMDTGRRGRVVRLAHAEQAVVRDPAGWERRILSPSLPGVEFEFMRTTLGPGIDAGTFDPHPPGSREYVAVESGELELSIDGTAYRLGAGDSIYYEADCDHGFCNRLACPCVYYMVMDIGGRAGTAHG